MRIRNKREFQLIVWYAQAVNVNIVTAPYNQSQLAKIKKISKYAQLIPNYIKKNDLNNKFNLKCMCDHCSAKKFLCASTGIRITANSDADFNRFV